MKSIVLALRQSLWESRNQPEIGFEDLDFRFPDGSEVFCGATLVAGKQGATLLLGPNGLGKSTALRILAGYLDPQKGRLLKPRDRRLSFSGPEGADLPPYAKCEGIVSRLDITANENRATIFEEIGLGGLSRRHIKTLSSGQRKRLSLFRALVSGRDGILLDEPLAHLDISSREEMLSVIKELRHSTPVVICTHDRNMINRFRDSDIDSIYWVDGYKPRGGKGQITRVQHVNDLDLLLQDYQQRR